MGAWGTKPLANDTALDFCFGIEKMPLPDLVRKGLNSAHYHEVRAAAWLLKRIMKVYPLEARNKDMKLAIERLQDIREDDEWLSEWGNRQKVVEDLVATIQAFEDCMSGIKRSRLSTY